ncbi:Glycoside hydrolase family 19 catalytic domain-containing protein [Enterobacter intestinihominis]|nr:MULTISPECIES: hypothetical protein [Enterobacter]EUL73800.1 hypothetical protein P833_01942 [Enterobacter hormaechei]MCW4894012.1 hypothetical protein [Enterobacter hormaechei subsp. xiangfangensis]MCW4944752.1 hypothetical protein [Enterobacter hormaechei subsp. xiangfangensis]WBV29559.1 hypothetical protein PBS85_11740 [Enterobacter hormaechei subsp. steigerwaltii]
MAAVIPKQSFPVPSDAKGQPFTSAEELLSKLERESSGLYLVGSQGMWHGGIHITDATIPWCALGTESAEEKAYRNGEPYKGEQFIRCMADGEIVAWRVCKDYENAAIEWRGENLFYSTSFVLVKHYIQPGETKDSELTFFTLYMNLAPFAAYKQLDDLHGRIVSSRQRYYKSKDDLQGGRAAGNLRAGTIVMLSNNIVTRSSDRRQFTEVSISTETKNAAGEILVAGTKVWTVSDQGSLKASVSAPVPSWWTKCTPPYTNQPEGAINCTSRTVLNYYLSSEDVLQYTSAGTLPADIPLSYESGNTTQQLTRPGKNAEDASRTFSLVTLGRDLGKMKKGDRVWVVSDDDNLAPVTPAASGSAPVFNDVHVPATPVPVSAGDSLGHMGFCQLPEENGKHSRYQVHIECLSMDDMEKFITNPGNVGNDSPVYLAWQKDAALSDKGDTGMTASNRKTKISGILTLAKVPGVDAAGNALSSNKDAAWFQIRPEGGWLAAGSVQKLSQYALGELGFVTLNKAPESFDLLDGIKQPNNVVKGILEQLYKVAQEETRPAHALNKYNYERLLKQIDSNQDGHYSEQEYLQAVHNVSYRERLYRIIAKHGSEWYYGKDDPLWKTYLDTLTKDAPAWKTYLETFIDKMTWMKTVTEKGVSLGPELWHMHPVVFLSAMVDEDEMALKWLQVPKGQLTFDAEGNDIDTSPWFSRKIHWPGGVSGVTIGRGYDLGQQASANADLVQIGVTDPFKSWLVGSQGLSGAGAQSRFNSASEDIRNSTITRKQQYDIFMISYQRLEDDVKRICQKPDTIRVYHSNPQATPEQAWSDIPEKIKEILVDLRYRGDYTPRARSLIQRYAYSGDLNSFGNVLSTRSNWQNVPEERFNQRVSFYEN